MRLWLRRQWCWLWHTDLHTVRDTNGRVFAFLCWKCGVLHVGGRAPRNPL